MYSAYTQRRRFAQNNTSSILFINTVVSRFYGVCHRENIRKIEISVLRNKMQYSRKISNTICI